MSENKPKLLWLSLGENCLPDDFLKRHNRKSFSSPYSSGRTNIDYACFLESENYESLLTKENLVYGFSGKLKVVRNNALKADDLFHPGCSLGFEFTHHDVIKSEKAIDSYKRKIQRLLEIRKINDVLFLYHHRLNAKSDIDLIKTKLEHFSTYYKSDEANCLIALFYQSKVSNKSNRRIELKTATNNLLEFVFHTEHTWTGEDQDIFWGRNDEDLITKMFQEIDGIIISKSTIS